MTVCMQCVPWACVDRIALFFFLLCHVLNRAGRSVVGESIVGVKWVCRNLNLAGTLAKCGEFVSALTVGKRINSELGEPARTYGKISRRADVFFASVSACYLRFSRCWKRQEHRLIQVACRKAFHRDYSGFSVI